MAMTILKLRLDVDREQSEALDCIARLCRKARNAGVENWLLRERGLPLNPKQAAKPQSRMVRGKDGVLSLRARETSSESTKIYHSMTAVTPELDTGLVSSLSREINSHLNAKVDWRKRGDDKTRKRRDEILVYEQRPPFSQALKIPIISQKAVFVYGSQTRLEVNPLKSAYGTVLKLKIHTKFLGAGKKNKLMDICEGRRKLQDSYLHFRPEKSSWYWYLPIEEDGAEPLDENVSITLMPTFGKTEDNRKDRPFYVDGDQLNREWYLGNPRYTLSQVKRLITAEKDIGYAYRTRRTGSGHGRKKLDDAIRLKRIRRRHQIEEFRRRLICEAIQQCERWNAGRLVYWKPSLPLRDRSWFFEKGLEWDWTRFESDLKNSAEKAGVKVKVEKLGLRDVYPKDKEK